jgi:hypothetical protein
MFVPVKPFQPSLMFVGKARVSPRVEPLKWSSLSQALALPANIRLSWKGLPA